MQKSKMHQLFVITFFILKIVMKGCGPTFTVLEFIRSVRQTSQKLKLLGPCARL